MGTPSFEDARRLADWEPALGVVSVFVRFDPGDRGGAWRTELRNALASILEADGAFEHDTRTALRETAKRILERCGNHERALPRGKAGFVEVARDSGEQRWWSSHAEPPGGTGACFAARPVIAPLLCLVDRGSPRGIALVSAERVRLLECGAGTAEELESWELSVFSRDWRERKAPRVADPARGQGVSAAGRDQFDERLAESRERFLAECGRLAARIGSERKWPQLLVFGAVEQVRELRQAAESSAAPPLAPGGGADLISVPDGKLQPRLEEAIERLAAERDRELIERALEETRGGSRGTAGPQETLAALDEGRVDHLLLDASRAAAASSSPLPRLDEIGPEEGVGSELLARRALAGAAKITTVCGETAELLAPVGGVAALLRY